MILLKYVKTGSVASIVLTFSKTVCCSDSQAQTVSCFCSLLRGSESSVKTGLNLYKYFIIPLKIFRDCIDCGSFMSTMALTFSGPDLRPSGVSLCLKNFHSVDLNCILSGLSERLFIFAVSSGVSILLSCWILVSPYVRISSTIPWTCLNSLSALSSLSWNTSLACYFSPNCSLSHLNVHKGVLNLVSRLLTKSKTTCQ